MPWHSLKTDDYWQAAMDATRNVTWTSFWRRTYRTRAHDYRQYLSTGFPPIPDPPRDHTGVAPHGEQLDLATQRHLASLLVYSALTSRQSRSYLAAVDDDPDSDVDLSDNYRYVWVRHTRERDGRKVSGPRPGTPSPEDILRTPADAVLRAEHWTTPFNHRSRGSGPTPPASDDQPPPF